MRKSTYMNCLLQSVGAFLYAEKGLFFFVDSFSPFPSITSFLWNGDIRSAFPYIPEKGEHLRRRYCYES